MKWEMTTDTVSTAVSSPTACEAGGYLLPVNTHRYYGVRTGTVCTGVLCSSCVPEGKISLLTFIQKQCMRHSDGVYGLLIATQNTTECHKQFKGFKVYRILQTCSCQQGRGLAPFATHTHNRLTRKSDKTYDSWCAQAVNLPPLYLKPIDIQRDYDDYI